MKIKNLVLVLLTATFIGAPVTGCGKASPVLPGTNNPNNPLNPNNHNGVNPPVTGMGSVVGRVVDSTGKGLSNVQLTIRNIITTSSLNGDFQLNNVPAGQQSLQLRLSNRQLNINVNVVADTAVTPDVNPIQFSNNGTGGSGLANSQLKTFKVDQDFFNQWQAKGVTATAGVIYVAVSDGRNLFKKGSIISMDAESGKSWKNIGSSWLGLRYPLDQTIRSVAANGTNLVAIDSKGALYSVENKKKVKVVKSGPGTDIAVGAGIIYIANGGSVERAESSGEGRTVIPNLSVSGGIATDSKGNLFAICGSGVKMVEAGSINHSTDVITQSISNAIDLAVDDKNGFIYVLESNGIKRFTTTGVLVANFGSGAQRPVSITTDELGNLYVADEGKDYKESKIVKFGPGNGNIPAFENSEFLKNGQNQNFDGTGENTDYTSNYGYNNNSGYSGQNY